MLLRSHLFAICYLITSTYSLSLAQSCTNGSPCDDGDLCTINDQCVNGVCTGTAIVCPDDGDPCTDEVCVPGIGCMSVPSSGSPCDDGDPCTINDVCINGVCAGTPMVCDDGLSCTTDACVGGVCVYTPVANGWPCDDGDACTTNDQCINGVCQGTSVICDDGDPCTDDLCDPITGCYSVPSANGSPCDDGDPCTTNDQCMGGVCAGTAIVCPDDGDPCTDEVCVPGIGCMSVSASAKSTQVTNNLDSGTGSLRYVVSISCPGDTVVFDPTIQAIVLNDEIVIEHDLFIVGHGVNSLEISGQNNHRAFRMSASTSVSLSRMTISNCMATANGGAFYSAGHVYLENMAFDDNFEGNTSKAWTSDTSVTIKPGTVAIR